MATKQGSLPFGGSSKSSSSRSSSKSSSSRSSSKSSSSRSSSKSSSSRSSSKPRKLTAAQREKKNAKRRKGTKRGNTVTVTRVIDLNKLPPRTGKGRWKAKK